MEARCTAEGEYYIWNRKEDLYYYFTKEKNEEKNTFYTKEADMALYNADKFKIYKSNVKRRKNKRDV